jgi:hypothetical protein
MALIEALSLIRQGADRVLLLCGDETLPEAWQGLLSTPVLPHALGLLIAATPEAGGAALEIETRGGLPKDQGDEGQAQSLRFLAWFLGGCSGSLELVHQGFALILKAG